MQTTQGKKRVGILRGGKGPQYASSLKRGGEIIAYISEYLPHKYKVIDILIDREGTWHMGGLPVLPSDLVHRVDVIWNTSHPSLSTLLHNFSIPSIGHSLFSHTLEHSKEMLREHMKKINLNMSRSLVIAPYQGDLDGKRELYSIRKAKEVHAKFPAPWIVRSFNEDKSMGIHLAKTFNELVGAIEDAVMHGDSILVEEFISGKIASVHSMPSFRETRFYTFPLGKSFGNFSAEEKDKLAHVAEELHTHINGSHYLRSNFVLTPRGKLYLLGIESNPSFKVGSHFEEVCDSAGVKIDQVIEHILENVAQ